MGLKTARTKKALGEDYLKRIRLKMAYTRVKGMYGEKNLAWHTLKSKSGKPLLSSCVRWTETSGIQKVKRFSVLKYGLLPAYQMSVIYRDSVRVRLLEEYENLLK